jgi:hypothetical protein
MTTMPMKTLFTLLGLMAVMAAGAVRAGDTAKQAEPTATAKEADAQSVGTAVEGGDAGKATDGGVAAKAGEPKKEPVSEAKPGGGTDAEAKEGEVARAAFAQAIEDREPMGEIEHLPEGADEVYYFTELRGLEGQTVTHRWLYQGEVKAEVSFEVGGPRWRVYSSKDLLPDWTGDWTVEVVSGDGRVLRQSAITFGS